jgi:acyl transferase domain-containing protein
MPGSLLLINLNPKSTRTTPGRVSHTSSVSDCSLLVPVVAFSGVRVRPFRSMLPRPETNGKPKHASVNSFRYGSANAYCILEEADATKQGQIHHVASIRSIDEVAQWVSDEADCCAQNGSIPLRRLYTLIVSANDAISHKDKIVAMCSHLVNPHVRLSLHDLAWRTPSRNAGLTFSTGPSLP